MREPEIALDTEVVVLIENEMVGEGVGDDDFDSDWPPTTERKASPRTRTTAREREWMRPTMTMVIDEEVSLAKAEERSARERNGDKGLNESDCMVDPVGTRVVERDCPP